MNFPACVFYCIPMFTKQKSAVGNFKNVLLYYSLFLYIYSESNNTYHHHQDLKQCTEVVKYPEKYTPEICQIYPIQKCQDIMDLIRPYLKTGIPYPKK